MRKAGHHRLAVAEVAREIDGDRPRIGSMQRERETTSGEPSLTITSSISSVSVPEPRARGCKLVDRQGRPVPGGHDGKFHVRINSGSEIRKASNLTGYFADML
jgi:hypothetical protein